MKSSHTAGRQKVIKLVLVFLAPLRIDCIGRHRRVEGRNRYNKDQGVDKEFIATRVQAFRRDQPTSRHEHVHGGSLDIVQVGGVVYERPYLVFPKEKGT
jgi:hypothetical protein